MYINFTTLVYLLCMVICFSIVGILYYLFKSKPYKTQKNLILSIMLINLFQHFLKCIVWPHYYKTGFGFTNTAENMCALLIIVAPIIFFINCDALKNFMVYVGSVAGILTIFVPYWFFGKQVYFFEIVRFYFCHLFILLSSILPALFRIYKIKFKNFWTIGLIFFVFLGILVLNVVIFYGIKGENVGYYVNAMNPVYLMRPPKEFAFIEKAIRYISPRVFLGENGVGYTPIMWYAIPMYLFITILSFILGIIIDKKGYKEFINKFKKGEK